MNTKKFKKIVGVLYKVLIALGMFLIYSELSLKEVGIKVEDSRSLIGACLIAAGVILMQLSSEIPNFMIKKRIKNRKVERRKELFYSSPSEIFDKFARSDERLAKTTVRTGKIIAMFKETAYRDEINRFLFDNEIPSLTDSKGQIWFYDGNEFLLIEPCHDIDGVTLYERRAVKA